MKLRIRSDGTPHGTRVESEDGELVRGVTRVCLIIDVHQPTTAVVSYVGLEMDLDAQAEATVLHDDRRGSRPEARLAGLFSSTEEARDEQG